MEPVQTKSRSRVVRPAVAVACLALVATCAVVACGRALKGYSLKDSLDPKIPVLDLSVAYYNPAGVALDARGNPVPEIGTTESSTGASSVGTTDARPPDFVGAIVATSIPTAVAATPTTATPTATAAPTLSNSESASGTPATCPNVVGGDVNPSPPPRQKQYSWEPTPVPCALKATWNVFRHPVGASLYIRDGAKVMEWYDRNPDIATFRDSKVWRGLIQQARVMLKVRAEDLELSDWQGEFLVPILNEALSADAVLHYDVVHGAGGLVLSFNRAKAPLLGRAVPVLVRTLAAGAFQISSLTQPIVELRLQGSRVYLTQRDDTVLIGSSLEGLLNVLVQGEMPAPAINGSAALVIRSEAFLSQLLPKVVGKETWPLAISFDLSGTTSSIAEGNIPTAKVFEAFASHSTPGVVAAVPADALAAVVMSAAIPLDKPVTEWTLNAGNKEAAGLSLVWDLRGDDAAFEVGIAVNAPQKPHSPELQPADFISSWAVTTSCAGGAVWLGASSDVLLTRMREACDKQSLSLLDVKGIDSSEFSKRQLSILVNSRVALHELYRAGGGKSPRTDAVPAETAAQMKLLGEVDAVALTLPVIGIWGSRDATSGDFALKGFTAKAGG